jgi:hypothetical protein
LRKAQVIDNFFETEYQKYKPEIDRKKQEAERIAREVKAHVENRREPEVQTPEPRFGDLFRKEDLFKK